jgi:hypothetical protein
MPAWITSRGRPPRRPHDFAFGGEIVELVDHKPARTLGELEKSRGEIDPESGALTDHPALEIDQARAVARRHELGDVRAGVRI